MNSFWGTLSTYVMSYDSHEVMTEVDGVVSLFLELQAIYTRLLSYACRQLILNTEKPCREFQHSIWGTVKSNTAGIERVVLEGLMWTDTQPTQRHEDGDMKVLKGEGTGPLFLEPQAVYAMKQ